MPVTEYHDETGAVPRVPQLGAVIEMMCSITNVILRSHYGKIMFPDTQQGEDLFNRWQTVVYEATRIVLGANHTDNDRLFETGLQGLESAFTAVFPDADRGF